VRLQALPWLRIKAVLTDEAGNVLGPALADMSTGQETAQSRTIDAGDAVPALLRVEMPPVSFGLVVDTSDSMGGREADLRAAVLTYLSGAEPAEAIDVLRFGTEVERLGKLPADRERVLKAVDGLYTTGNTALYQALSTGLPDKQALVLLSDGMNTILDGAGFADVCRQMRSQPTPIYVIGVGHDLYEFDASSGNTAIDLLRNLARGSGGRFAFAPESDELTSLYRGVAADVRRNTDYRLHVRWEGSPAAAELAHVATAMRGPAVTGPVPPGEAELGTVPIGGAIRAAGVELPPALPELHVTSARSSLKPFEVEGLPVVGSPELATVAVTRELRPFDPRGASLAALPETALPALVGRPRPLPGPAWGRLQVKYQPAKRDDPPLPTVLLPAYELILDSSESMNEKLGAEPKLEAARKVTRHLLESLPDGAQVGLRLYGHWGVWLPRRTDSTAGPLERTDPRLNTDSDLVVAIGLLTADHRKRLKTWIDWTQPRGKTPMVYSLLEAQKDFPAEWRGPRTIVLISDGMETCGGKLADVEAAYKGTDFGVVIHVVGFDIKETVAESQLRSIAAAGSGRYFPAADARQLAEALRSAVGSTSFVVLDRDGKTPLARGLVNGDVIELPPGSYRALLPSLGEGAVAVDVGASSTSLLRLTNDAQLIQEKSP
jgi:Mg-chelatase subunit ChlD